MKRYLAMCLTLALVAGLALSTRADAVRDFVDAKRITFTGATADYVDRHFEKWTGDVNANVLSNAMIELVMDRPRTIGATFGFGPIDISAWVGGGLTRTLGSWDFEAGLPWDCGRNYGVECSEDDEGEICAYEPPEEGHFLLVDTSGRPLHFPCEAKLSDGGVSISARVKFTATDTYPVFETEPQEPVKKMAVKTGADVGLFIVRAGLAVGVPGKFQLFLYEQEDEDACYRFAVMSDRTYFSDSLARWDFDTWSKVRVLMRRDGFSVWIDDELLVCDGLTSFPYAPSASDEVNCLSLNGTGDVDDVVLSQTLSGITVVYEKEHVWSNRPVEPAVSVISTDYGTMRPDVDYRVEYQDNDRVGTALIVVTGIGAFTGSVTNEFIIVENTLGAALNYYQGKVETDADHPWTADTAHSHDGVASLKSAAVANGSSFVKLSTEGAGRLSFWWRASCEPSVGDRHSDYGLFAIEGVEVAKIVGETEWCRFVTNLTTTGEHVLQWEYRKSDDARVNGDCIWLDQVVWTPADGSGKTVTSGVPVPYSWLEGYGLGEAGDFETAANAKTGKRSALGEELTVWEDYVAGTNPTNRNSVFRLFIDMSSGKPKITWDPDLNENGTKHERDYQIWGAKRLGGEWLKVKGDESNYNFYRISVELPQKKGY